MGRRSCPSCGAVMGIGSRACEECGFDPDVPTAGRTAAGTDLRDSPPTSGVHASDRGDPSSRAPLTAAPAPEAPGATPPSVLRLVDGAPDDEVSLGRFRRWRSPAAPVEETEVDEDRGSSRSSHARRAALGVLVAVGVLAAAAAVVGRGEDAGSREAGREAERARTSTTTALSTTQAVTTGDRSLTSFTDMRLGAPLSPVPTGGTVVYGLSEAGQVVRIDVDQGDVQSRLLRNPNGDRPSAGYRVVARQGAALLVNQAGDVLVVPDGDGTRTDWRPAWGKLFPADSPDQVWHVTGDLSGDRLATLEQLDGTPVGALLSLPPRSIAEGTDRAGGMQFDNLGQRFRVRSSSSGSELLADTPLLASNDAVIVQIACADPGQCTWTSVDRATGAPNASGEAPLTLVVPGPSSVLSPDNRYLARVSGQDGATSLTLLDLQAGTSRVVTADLQADLAPVWTAVGNQLLFLDDRGELYRFDAATGEDEVLCGTCFRPLVALDAVGPTLPGDPVTPTTTVPDAADMTAILPTTPLSMAP